jgi:hypothetical protein
MGDMYDRAAIEEKSGMEPWRENIRQRLRQGAQAASERVKERERSSNIFPGISPEDVSYLYEQALSGKMDEADMSQMLTSLTLSRHFGAPLDDIIKNKELYLTELGVDVSDLKPTSFLDAAGKALRRGQINLEKKVVAGSLRGVEREGNTEAAEYYWKQIDALDDEIRDNADLWADKRWKTTKMVTGIAESAPYMIYVSAGSIAGGMMGGPAGTIGGFLAGMSYNSDTEYLSLRKAGIKPDTADTVSMWTGAAQAAVEAGIGRGFKMAGTALAKMGIGAGSAAAGKLIETVVNGVITKLHLTGAPYWIAKIGLTSFLEWMGEGNEEVIQRLESHAGLLIAKNIQMDKLKKALADPESPESRELLKATQDIVLEKEIENMGETAALEFKAQLLGWGIEVESWGSVLRELPQEFEGGFLSAILLSGVDILLKQGPGAVKSARFINSAAAASSSFEEMKNLVKQNPDLEDIHDAQLKKIYDSSVQRRDREEARIAAEIKARGSQLAGLEERQVDQAGEDVTPGVYRNPDKSLYTRIEDQKREGSVVTGSFRMGDGSRKTESNTYGAIDYRIENGVLTITGMNIADHRKELTGEFYQAFAKKFANADIQWNPETEAAMALKEQLVADNRRGPDAGLNYFEPEAVRGESLETQRVKQDFDRQLKEALPRSTAESRQGAVSLLDRIGKGYGLDFDEWIDRLGFDRNNVFTNTPNQDVRNFNDRAAQYAKDPDRPAARGAMFKVLKNLDDDVKAVEYNIVYLDPKTADFSTVVHELKHAVDNFLEQADPDLYRRMMDAAGEYDPKSGMDEKTWRKERSAYAWENYLQTGEAPTTELRQLFRQMVEWLRDMVNNLSGMRKLTPEQKAAFDELLTKADSFETESAETARNGPQSRETQKDTANIPKTPLRAATGLSEGFGEGGEAKNAGQYPGLGGRVDSGPVQAEGYGDIEAWVKTLPPEQQENYRRNKDLNEKRPLLDKNNDKKAPDYDGAVLVNEGVEAGNDNREPGALPVTIDQLNAENRTAINQLLEKARYGYSDIEKVAKGWADNYGGRVEGRPMPDKAEERAKLPKGRNGEPVLLKGVKRIIEKHFNEETFFNEMTDVAGFTVVVKDYETLIKMAEEVSRDGAVVRVKDRYKKPVDGYQDFLLNIRTSDGFVGEIQLTVEQMFQAKQNFGGHALYDVIREMNLAKGKELTEKQIDHDKKILKEISKKFYGKATGLVYSAARATASSLDMASPSFQEYESENGVGDKVLSAFTLNKLTSLLANSWSFQFTNPVMDGSSTEAGTESGRRQSGGGLTGHVPENVQTGLPSTVGTAGLDEDLTNRNSGILEAGASRSAASATSVPSSSNIGQNGESVKGEIDVSGVPAIREKYRAAKKTEGYEDTKNVGGEEIAGRWVLVEAETPTASHDETTFSETRGFPASQGASVNDRDYRHEQAAQEAVVKMAGEYDSRALEGIVITDDGIVISGNNRTMSGKRAAREGTDGKYTAALEKKAKKYGFTAEQVREYRHPRLVFEVAANGGYSTDLFARFNESTRKAQSPMETAVKMAKRLAEKPDVVKSIANVIDLYDSLPDMYGNKKAVLEIFNTLQTNGLIGEYERPLFVDEKGVITGAGEDRLESVTLGAVLDEGNIRGLQEARAIRQKLLRGITALMENRAMGDYSFIPEMNEAVRIALAVNNTVGKNGKRVYGTVQDYVKQQILPGMPAGLSVEKRAGIQLAEALESGGQKDFALWYGGLNASLAPAARGQADMFTGTVESKESILDRYVGFQDEINERKKENHKTLTDPAAGTTAKAEAALDDAGIAKAETDGTLYQTLFQTEENIRTINTAITDIANGAEEATAKGIRPDLAQYGGNGDVTFIWGDEKKGLYHIGHRRGPEIVAGVIKAVLMGDVSRFVESAKTVTLSYGDYDAFLSLDLHGQPHTWLLTGWKKNVPDAVREPLSNPNATQTGLTFSRADLGAGTLQILNELSGEVNNSPDILFQTYDELLEDAARYESAEDFEAAYRSPETRPEDAYISTEADRRWYEIFWRDARIAAGLAGEAASTAPEQGDRAFLRDIDRNKLRDILDTLDEKLHDRRKEPAAPEAGEDRAAYDGELAEYEKARDLRARINRELPHAGAWVGIAAKVANGEELSARDYNTLRGYLRDAPRDYRALFAELAGRREWGLNLTEMKDGVPDTPLSAPRMERPDDMDAKNRERLAGAIGEADPELARGIRDGTVTMDDPRIAAFEKGLDTGIKKADEAIAAVEAEIAEDARKFKGAVQGRALDLYREFKDAEERYQARTTDLAQKIRRGGELTGRQDQMLLTDFDSARVAFEDFAAANNLRAEVREELARIDTRYAERKRLGDLQKKRNAVREVKRIEESLVKRIIRKISLKTVAHDEAAAITIVQSFFEPSLIAGVNHRLGTIRGQALRELYEKWRTDADFREELRREAGSRAAKIGDILGKPQWDYISNQEKRDLIRMLPKRDWIQELKLEKLEEYRNDLVPLDIKISAEGKAVLGTAEEQIAREALGDELYSRILNKPLENWTMLDLAELAEVVDDLYVEGRENLRAKNEARYIQYENYRNKLSDLLRITRYQINPGDSPEERKRKQAEIAKILGKYAVGDPGAEAAKLARRSLLERVFGGAYFDANIRRVARILDNGKDGTFTNLLYWQENDAFNLRERARMFRRLAVEDSMRKLEIKMPELFQQVTVKDLWGTGRDQVYTVEELLGMKLASRDELSRRAVIYGNLATETERSKVRNDNDTSMLERLDDTAEGRYAKVTAAADVFFKQEGNDKYLKFLEAIARDYDGVYDRLNQANIDTFNEPVWKVAHYFPMFRLEQTGGMNEHQEVKDLLGLAGVTTQWTDNGMTQTRIPIGPQNQTAIELGLYTTWAKSLDRVEHFIAYAPYVKTLNAVFKSRDGKSLMQQVQDRYGAGMGNYLKEYINEKANPTAENNRHASDNIVKAMRGRTASAYLAWKTSGVLKQLATSPWPYLQYMSPLEYGGACTRFYQNPKAMSDFIRGKSVFMATRSFDPILKIIREQQTLNRNKALGKLDQFNNLGMKGLEMIDWTCVAPGWLAVYNREMARLQKANEGLTADQQLNMADMEYEAVARADDIVRLTQPSSRDTDQAPMFKNTPQAIKAILQFTQSLNVIWQNIR